VGAASKQPDAEHAQGRVAAASSSKAKKAGVEAVSQQSIDELQKKLQEVKSQISEMTKQEAARQEPHRRVGRP
jgi:TolA-binding protein